MNTLRRIEDPIVDGENNAIEFDVAYAISGDQFLPSLKAIFEHHGKDVRLLPISGASGGGGVFQRENNSDKTVVGLKIQPTPSPQITQANSPDICTLALDEIVMDAERKLIFAGASITLEQLNSALADTLGHQYKVLGADLTSYTYAQVGATFMTGGMGPQRRYFSDSVEQIALYNGDGIARIEGDQLTSFAGSYGWSGIVTAVCCRISMLPQYECAFALPVDNTPQSLTHVLQHLSQYAYLNVSKNRVTNTTDTDDVILGIEHITADAMQPFLKSGDNALTRRAWQILENCQAANADGILFINGYSDQSTDDFLLSLVDDANTEPLTIAGINLEYAEIFPDPDQMRAVREGVPAAARMQSPRGDFIFKGHTDAVIKLNPDCVEHAMMLLWQTNNHYVQAVDQYFQKTNDVHGEILVYGHLNPVGVDPHNRITFTCGDAQTFKKAKTFIHQKMCEFYRALSALCEETGSEFVGGEKSAASESEILEAFSVDDAPQQLTDKRQRQRQIIQASSSSFNWRAISSYS